MSITSTIALALSLLLLSTVKSFVLPSITTKVPHFAGRGPHFSIWQLRPESRRKTQTPTLEVSWMTSNDQIGEESNEPVGDDQKAVDNSKGPLFFGLSPTNPQDWITVVLTGIIVYETFDLVVFWFQKLTGFQGFQAQ